MYNIYILCRYTNGQVKTWNISTEESQTYEPSDKSLQLLQEDDEGVLGTSENCVTSVNMGDNDILIAGYKHGKLSFSIMCNISPRLLMLFGGRG